MLFTLILKKINYSLFILSVLLLKSTEHKQRDRARERQERRESENVTTQNTQSTGHEQAMGRQRR